MVYDSVMWNRCTEERAWSPFRFSVRFGWLLCKFVFCPWKLNKNVADKAKKHKYVPKECPTLVGHYLRPSRCSMLFMTVCLSGVLYGEPQGSPLGPFLLHTWCCFHHIVRMFVWTHTKSRCRIVSFSTLHIHTVMSESCSAGSVEWSPPA